MKIKITSLRSLVATGFLLLVLCSSLAAQPHFQQPAPELILPDKAGKQVDLRAYRNHYVLVDFWASWCGPCRKENPNVVKTYEKYKDAGFTVMSVSLDKDRAAWQTAIEKDGLKWPYHVSDLGFWSSKVPQLYQVRGIPFTVLIDRAGKIIKTNLRGELLEAELSQIFGF